MNILFFLENGLCSLLTGEVAVELFIHIWTVAFGLSAIVTIWRHRGEVSNAYK